MFASHQPPTADYLHGAIVTRIRPRAKRKSNRNGQRDEAPAEGDRGLIPNVRREGEDRRDRMRKPAVGSVHRLRAHGPCVPADERPTIVLPGRWSHPVSSTGKERPAGDVTSSYDGWLAQMNSGGAWACGVGQAPGERTNAGTLIDPDRQSHPSYRDDSSTCVSRSSTSQSKGLPRDMGGSPRGWEPIASDRRQFCPLWPPVPARIRDTVAFFDRRRATSTQKPRVRDPFRSRQSPPEPLRSATPNKPNKLSTRSIPPVQIACRNRHQPPTKKAAANSSSTKQ